MRSDVQRESPANFQPEQYQSPIRRGMQFLRYDPRAPLIFLIVSLVCIVLILPCNGPNIIYSFGTSSDPSQAITANFLGWRSLLSLVPFLSGADEDIGGSRISKLDTDIMLIELIVALLFSLAWLGIILANTYAESSKARAPLNARNAVHADREGTEL